METLGKHFRTLTEATFRRYGFAYADLAAQWPAIVGQDLAAVTLPERIRWPRTAAETESSGRHRQGGTLVVRVDGGQAIYVQHEVPRIIERINQFYGYAAVTAVKVLQGPVARTARQRAEPPELGADRERALEARLAGIGEPALKDALGRLGAAALARRGPRGGR